MNRFDTENLKSENPCRIAAYSDACRSEPVAFGADDVIAEALFLAQPFSGCVIGFPTWSREHCGAQFALYRWDSDYETTLQAKPLFTETITEIRDCALRDIPFKTSFPAGMYLFSVSHGVNDPGLWIFAGHTSEGTLFQNGKEGCGEFQLLIDFDCTPELPFTNRSGSLKIEPTSSEKARARRNYTAYLSDLPNFPTEITIGGVTHRGFDGSFTLLSRETEEKTDREVTRLTFSHESGLTYVLTATFYPGYAAYEWSAELLNDTDKPSLRVTDWKIASADYPVTNAVLRGIHGDGGFHHDPYSPYALQLTETKISFFSPSGRSTYNRFPYFNISGDDCGLLFVCGWVGKWETEFSETHGSVHMAAWQKTLDAPVPAHERLISPVVLFLEYNGKDPLRTTNLWRHFFLDCNMKKPGGKLFPPHISGGTSWVYDEMKDATDDNQIASIRAYVEHGVPIDFWWMDAGWYYKTGEEALDVWLPVGTWVVDKKRFPSGMKAISDYGHKNGVETLLWFEPEICRLADSELGETSVHQDWIIPGSGTRLVDIGKPEFRDWMLDRVFRIMDEGNIDLYRQDYGIAYPTDEMHAGDPAGVSGYIENRYYQGYYDYLDRIAARYPDKMLDSCAAGGGRNDLTTMRRSVPLHKTDADYSDYTMKTAMHQSLFAWLPYFGTPISNPDSAMVHPDLYLLRCNYCPWMALGADVLNPDTDWELYRRACLEWQRIKDYFYADYYPLLPWDNTKQAWRGWEFFDPDREEGYFQLFRDEDSIDPAKEIRLHGLRRSSLYRLTDLDGKPDVVLSGDELMRRGVTVELPKRASAVTLIQRER